MGNRRFVKRCRIMLKNLKQSENVMKYKLVYTGLIFLIYIFGKNIPLCGVDMSAYTVETAGAGEILMQMISGDTYRCSIFALGIFPFMISNILVQLAYAIRNLFSKARVSPKAMGYATAFVTLAIAISQAVVQIPKLKFAVPAEMLAMTKVVAGIEMVTGVMVILWMAGRNGRYGIGGRMVFALVNILERLLIIFLEYHVRVLLLPLMIGVVMMVVMIVMENAEMRIPVQRVSIHNIYADKNYMAIKLNPVGAMPLMFTSAVFMLPQLLIALLAYFFPQNAWVVWWQENVVLTNPFGIAVYVACEYLITIGFSMIMISPKDISEQFLKSGDSIVNIHAGQDTRRYLRRTVLVISFFSATVMGVCVAVPLILQAEFNVDGGPAMLPVTIMLLVSFLCNIFRELFSIYKYDSCRALF